MKKKQIKGKLALNKKTITELSHPETAAGGWFTFANTDESCVSDCLCPVTYAWCVNSIDGCPNRPSFDMHCPGMNNSFVCPTLP